MRPTRKGGALDHPGDAAVMRLQALVARQRGELDGLRSLDAERSEFDLARGIIMGQLGCSPGEARRQLERMARRAGISASELAAQIAEQAPPAEEPSTGWYKRSLAAAREQLADTEERAAEEHYLALRLQQAITPRTAEPLAADGLDIAARHRPSGPGKLVSGDWYDAVQLPGGVILLVVGDIAGHGLDAVTGMVAMRNGLRGLAATGARPATLLGWLNVAACHFGPGAMGTVICGQFDPDTHRSLYGMVSRDSSNHRLESCSAPTRMLPSARQSRHCNQATRCCSSLTASSSDVTSRSTRLWMNCFKERASPLRASAGTPTN